MIIVDNHQENPEIEDCIGRLNNYTRIYSDVMNPYTNRNKGVQHAKGEFVGFLDAKCVPSKEWVEVAVTSMKKGSDRILSGRYHVIPATIKTCDLVYGLLYLNNEKNVIRDYGVTTGNLIVAKKTFEKIGPFQDKHRSGNDIIWTRRANQKGYSLTYLPELLVSYPGQPYDQLLQSIPKYVAGIVHRYHTHPQRGIIHIKNIFFYLFPMRISNFREALKYRGLLHFPLKNKIHLWFLIWQIKLRMAFYYIRFVLG